MRGLTSDLRYANVAKSMCRGLMCAVAHVQGFTRKRTSLFFCFNLEGYPAGGVLTTHKQQGHLRTGSWQASECPKAVYQMHVFVVSFCHHGLEQHHRLNGSS